MVAPTPLRTPAEEALLKRFPAEKSALPGLGSVREAAFARFAETGLPHRRMEAWKYTDLRANVRAIAPAAGPADVTRVSAMAPAVPGDGAYRIVVANGRVVPALSQLSDLPAGLTVSTVAEALAAGDPLIGDAIARVPGAAENTAVALNTAFMTDGLVISVADGAEIERPIEIAHVADGDAPVSTAVRNVVRVGAGAKVTLIETLEATTAVAHQTNTVTDIVVGDEAEVDHIRLQIEPAETLNLSTITAEIGARARFDTFHAALGSGMSRAQVFSRLVGREAVAGFRGITMLSGRRHADVTLVLTHDAEACESRELFKAVIDDEGRSVFQGRINVPAHAQKTDARMMSASLLLSDGAEANAKPELEIFADDVQCGHGATCGALDDDLMFYMLARGISKAEAEKMLILAFLGEAIDEVHNEAVRDALIHRVEDWLERRVQR